MDAVEVAYTVTVAKRATISAALFRNEKRDVIDFAPTAFYGPDDPPADWPLPAEFVPENTLPKAFSFRNFGSIVSVGLELGANVGITSGVNAVASYTWQDEPDVDDEAIGTLFTNIPPEHQLSLSLDLDRHRWFGSVGVTYTDEAFWQGVLDSRFWGTTDSYTLLNSAIGVRLGERLVLSIKGTNLTDERAKQHVFGDIIGRKVSTQIQARF